jgi:cytochrome c6
MKTLRRSLRGTKSVIGIIVMLAGLSLAAQSQNDSAALYKSKCAMCHGADGAGSTPAGKAMGAKDFRSPEVAKESDADLQAVIENGRNKMPAYKGKLTADQIGGLVKYIRQLQGK